MSKEQIIRKLTSRKFLAALGLLIYTILCQTGVIPIPEQEAWKVIILGAAGIIAYIFSEGATDVASIIQEGKNDK